MKTIALMILLAACQTDRVHLDDGNLDYEAMLATGDVVRRPS